MSTILAAIDPNLKWYLVLFALTVALVVGTVLVSQVWNDVKGNSTESLTDPADLITPLTEAFEAGQMSDEEYHRIRESIERGVSADPVRTLPIRTKPSQTVASSAPDSPRDTYLPPSPGREEGRPT